MTLVKHEWKLGWKGFSVWTAAIGFFIVICVFMYPEMKGEMENVSDLFASMGAFTAAFGMDRLNFGTLIGFYAVECGNILGIGGAFFAAMIAAGALVKEEKDGTAEFLLAHPVRRVRIVTEKLIAVMTQIAAMNAIVFGLSALSVVAIGEEMSWKTVGLLHLANFLVQIELAGICFGISAFLRRGGLGIGMGIAIGMYFLNIVANLSENGRFLKNITPFGFAEGADIVAEGCLDTGRILLGMSICAAAIAVGYWHYHRKDIH